MLERNEILPAAAGGGARGGEIDARQTPAEVFDFDVTAPQAQAIELIMSGRSMSAVATAVGVDRGTLYRWRTEDEEFIGALKRWRALTQQAARDRLLAMSDAASEAIEKSVAAGDARLGYKVLAAMGCMQPGPAEESGARTAPHMDPLAREFQRIARTMTREQVGRATELLALGVQVDNERAAAAKAKGNADDSSRQGCPPLARE